MVEPIYDHQQTAFEDLALNDWFSFEKGGSIWIKGPETLIRSLSTMPRSAFDYWDYSYEITGSLVWKVF